MKTLAVLGLAVALLGPVHPVRASERSVIVATDAVVRASGLLEALALRFEAISGASLKVSAASAADAFELGRRGAVDVLLVASPVSEDEFMSAGHGVRRRPVMRSPLVLVGPPDDPAGVKGKGPAKALAAVAAARAPFVAGEARSGVHEVETGIWQRASVTPGGSWYLAAGPGPEPVLRLASERRAYALAHRASYLALRKTLDLSVLLQGVKVLETQYHVIEVRRADSTDRRTEWASALAGFLVGPEAQAVIRTFGRAEYGEPLFMPDAP